MSLQKKNIDVIILCAGKGTRMGSKYDKLPKSLIEIKNMGNKPILKLIIDSIVKNPLLKRVFVVVGYRKEEIISYLKSDFPQLLNSKIFIVDASEHYEKGPLFSLISILSTNFITENHFFALIPGDTFYDNDLILKEAFAKIKINFNAPMLFYKESKGKDIQRSFKSKDKVNILQIKSNRKNMQTIENLSDLKVNQLSKKESYNIILPIFAIDVKFITYLKKFALNKKVNKLFEALKMLFEVIQIKCVKIQSKGNYFDIDSEADIELFEKKKDGQ